MNDLICERDIFWGGFRKLVGSLDVFCIEVVYKTWTTGGKLYLNCCEVFEGENQSVGLSYALAYKLA